MITMVCWCALWSEGEHDIRSVAPHKEDDLADKPIGIDFAQDAVAMSRSRERGDTEYVRSGGKLATPASGKLRARRNGDAGILAGIPVSGAEKIDLCFSGGELGDRSARRERLVVRMCEYAAESTHVGRR
jgi:hypothetical protein